jgi:hypothetical protein
MLEPLPHLAHMPVHRALDEYLGGIAPERINPDIAKQLTAALGDVALVDASLDIVSTPVAAHQEADPSQPLEDTTIYNGCRAYAELPDAPPVIILGLNRPPNADERSIDHANDAIARAKRNFGHKLPWLIPIDMGEYEPDEVTIGQLRAHNFHGILEVLQQQSGNPEAEAKLLQVLLHNRDIDVVRMSSGFFPTIRRARAEHDPSGMRIATSRLQHTASGLPNIDKLINIYDLLTEVNEAAVDDVALNDCTSAFGLLSYMSRNGIDNDMKAEIHSFLLRGAKDPLVVSEAVSEQSSRRLVEKLLQGILAFWEGDFRQTESYRTPRACNDLPDDAYREMNIKFLKVIERWHVYHMKLHFGEVAGRHYGLDVLKKQRDVAEEAAYWTQSNLDIIAKLDAKGIVHYDLAKRLEVHLANAAFNDRAALNYLKPR